MSDKHQSDSAKTEGRATNSAGDKSSENTSFYHQLIASSKQIEEHIAKNGYSKDDSTLKSMLDYHEEIKAKWYGQAGPGFFTLDPDDPPPNMLQRENTPDVITMVFGPGIQAYLLPYFSFRWPHAAEVHSVDQANLDWTLPDLVKDVFIPDRFFEDFKPECRRHLSIGNRYFCSQKGTENKLNFLDVDYYERVVAGEFDYRFPSPNQPLYWVPVNTNSPDRLGVFSKTIKDIIYDAMVRGYANIVLAPLGFNKSASTATKIQYIRAMHSGLSSALDAKTKKSTLDIYITAESFETLWLMKKVFSTEISATVGDEERTDLPTKLLLLYIELIVRARTDNNIYSAILKKLTIYLKEDVPLLLLGETGVGKSTLAGIVHELSNRSGRYEEINCAAIDRHNFTIEILGHDKGAYTDAKVQRAGIFERAGGGTVLLDEIDKLNLSEQGSILTILSTQTVRRLGAENSINISNVRIIYGTNANLPELVRQGRLLKDLYRRILKGIPIEIPPLRDRKEDIPLFAEKELRDLNKKYRSKITAFLGSGSDDFHVSFDRNALSHLTEYYWEFNVGGLADYLENVFIRAYKYGIEKVTAEFLKEHPPTDTDQVPTQNHDLREFERSLLRLIEMWNPDIHGDFRKEFLYPALAKVAFKDWQGGKSQKEAGVRVGITPHGTETFKNTLKYFLAQYPAAVLKLFPPSRGQSAPHNIEA